ncbi:hypothetical protein BC830DRAFT_1083266 [Chytriomyces sp. MP71]|nr:hypothetical protein BC830DRAFT_1083266 [Chytriomyces sp. MP71]
MPHQFGEVAACTINMVSLALCSDALRNMKLSKVKYLLPVFLEHTFAPDEHGDEIHFDKCVVPAIEQIDTQLGLDDINALDNGLICSSNSKYTDFHLGLLEFVRLMSRVVQVSVEVTSDIVNEQCHRIDEFVEHVDTTAQQLDTTNCDSVAEYIDTVRRARNHIATFSAFVQSIPATQHPIDTTSPMSSATTTTSMSPQPVAAMGIIGRPLPVNSLSMRFMGMTTAPHMSARPPAAMRPHQLLQQSTSTINRPPPVTRHVQGSTAMDNTTQVVTQMPAHATDDVTEYSASINFAIEGAETSLLVVLHQHSLQPTIHLHHQFVVTVVPAHTLDQLVAQSLVDCLHPAYIPVRSVQLEYFLPGSIMSAGSQNSLPPINDLANLYTSCCTANHLIIPIPKVTNMCMNGNALHFKSMSIPSGLCDV